jgi:hypothetical protein
MLTCANLLRCAPHPKATLSRYRNNRIIVRYRKSFLTHISDIKPSLPQEIDDGWEDVFVGQKLDQSFIPL